MKWKNGIEKIFGPIYGLVVTIILSIDFSAFSETVKGQEMEEKLKVPVYATHHVMKKLFQVSETVHKMGVYDLDRSLLILFSSLMGKSLCKSYDVLLSKPMSDKVNLQLLFDVYFVQRIFEGTWSLDASEYPEKLEFKRMFQSLIGSYKAKVNIFILKK